MKIKNYVLRSDLNHSEDQVIYGGYVHLTTEVL